MAFDPEQLWYSQALVPATPENLAACEAWVRGAVEARGLTDIMSPLSTAIGVLSNRPPGDT